VLRNFDQHRRLGSPLLNLESRVSVRLAACGICVFKKPVRSTPMQQETRGFMGFEVIFCLNDCVSSEGHLLSKPRFPLGGALSVSCFCEKHFSPLVENYLLVRDIFLFSRFLDCSNAYLGFFRSLGSICFCLCCFSYNFSSRFFIDWLRRKHGNDLFLNFFDFS